MQLAFTTTEELLCLSSAYSCEIRAEAFPRILDLRHAYRGIFRKGSAGDRLPAPRLKTGDAASDAAGPAKKALQRTHFRNTSTSRLDTSALLKEY